LHNSGPFYMALLPVKPDYFWIDAVHNWVF